MSNETKHRPSEVLLQLMRFTWDPTFAATDLDITMGEAMEVYRATIEMETKMEAEPNTGKNPGKKARGAATPTAQMFSGPGAAEKKKNPCAAYGALCRPWLRHRESAGGGHRRSVVLLGHFDHEGTRRRPDVGLART